MTLISSPFFKGDYSNSSHFILTKVLCPLKVLYNLLNEILSSKKFMPSSDGVPQYTNEEFQESVSAAALS